MVKHPRVLGTVRLSILKDDTTSPEKQRHAVEHWASGPTVGGRIVGFAEDLDVSGAMHPFKRPGLGPWFSERADDWDVLAVWKLDRLSRKTGHFAEVLEWCQERGKTIVSVTEGIDMGTPMGKMFANVGSTEDGNRRVVVKMPELAEIAEEVGLPVPEGYLWVEPEAEYVLPRQMAYKRK